MQREIVVIHDPKLTSLPAQSHWPTSRLAAQAAAPTAPKCEREVLEVFIGAGVQGCTQCEVSRVLGGRSAQSVTPRVASLYEKGLVAWCGERRSTVHGRLADVLVYRGAIEDHDLVVVPRPKGRRSERQRRKLAEDARELAEQDLARLQRRVVEVLSVPFNYTARQDLVAELTAELEQ